MWCDVVFAGMELFRYIRRERVLDESKIFECDVVGEDMWWLSEVVF